jgi:protein-L-isoaspartate(D-aspartate) O-methyltransferase
MKFTAPRARLVAELQEKGIMDARVLKAVGAVPRERFIDSALTHRAYEDTALPIGLKQTISQPYTVARQSELMELKPGEKVLEIGTGSGYQCAILCEMGQKVFSVERHEELYRKSGDLIRALGHRAELKCGDGTLGWSAYAPYDAIVVTAGAPVVPDALLQQLVVGGRLVIPVGDQSGQAMLRLRRVSHTEFEEERFDGFKFVPLIGKDGW